jgi:hypothetical protein
MLTKMDPAKTAHVEVFTFMPPLIREPQHNCKLLVDGSLGQQSRDQSNSARKGRV